MPTLFSHFRLPAIAAAMMSAAKFWGNHVLCPKLDEPTEDLRLLRVNSYDCAKIFSDGNYISRVTVAQVAHSPGLIVVKGITITPEPREIAIDVIESSIATRVVVDSGTILVLTDPPPMETSKTMIGKVLKEGFGGFKRFFACPVFSLRIAGSGKKK